METSNPNHNLNSKSYIFHEYYPHHNPAPAPRVTRGLNKKLNLGVTDNIVLNDYSNLRHMQTIEKRIEQLKAKKDIKKNNGSPKLVIRSHYFSEDNQSPSVNEKEKIVPPSPPKTNQAISVSAKVVYEVANEPQVLSNTKNTPSPSRIIVDGNEFDNGVGSVIVVDKEKEKITTPIVEEKKSKSASTLPKIVIRDNESGRTHVKVVDKDRDRDDVSDNLKKKLQYAAKELELSSREREMISEKLNEARLIENGLRMHVKELGKERDEFAMFASQQTEKINELQRAHEANVNELAKKHNEAIAILKGQCEKLTKENEELKKSSNPNPNPKKDTSRMAVLPYAYNLYHALGFEDVPESTNDIEKNKELSALISSKLRKILLVHHPDRPNRPPHSNEVCAWVVNVQGILLDFRKRRLYDSVIAERYFPEGYDNTPRSVAEFSTSRLYVPHGGVFNTDFCALNEFISGVLRVYTPYNEEFLAGADLLPPKPKQSLMYSNSILNRKA